MHEELNFTIVEGEKKPFDITVYALSTCGFCKRALEFLREHKIAFRFIYVDQQTMDIKNKIKQDLRDNYEERIGFPYVVYNKGKHVMVGFREENWIDTFLK